MPHDRQTIREAVVTALKAADTAACGNVYASRIDPLRRGQEYPALCVYILRETVDEVQQDAYPREYVRRSELVIEGWVSPRSPCEPDDIADALDDLSLEIETAMNLDPTFGSVAEDSYLDGTELDLSDRGEKSLGFLALRYEMLYRTEVIDTATLEDLETVDARYNLEGDLAEADEVEDTITIPTV